MAKKLRDYTEVGKRIAALATTQKLIARALGIGPQTVSRKLLGEVSISVADIETLSTSFKVPMSYFFADEKSDPDLEVILKRIRSEDWPLRHFMVLARKLSTRDQKKLLKIAKALEPTASRKD